MPFRTDLAMESAQCHAQNLPAGVSQSETGFGSLKINTVEITGEEGSELLGKPIGRYVTIMTTPFHGSAEIGDDEIQRIADEIASFLPKEGLILVIGLGNNDITPDAIGPRTARMVLATRHFCGKAAQDAGIDGLRPAAALAPGVLGQTGIETSEIVSSIVRDIKPAAVVVIDALAARDISRLGSTVQISDAGISPGSGVQNHRRELSAKTLNAPVVSIGIPTVVDAATLVSDLLEGDAEAQSRVCAGAEGMMITPREIDVLIDHACKTLALAVNKAIQPQMTLDELTYLAG